MIINPTAIDAQVLECKEIIKAIQDGKYHDAGIRIKFNLNDNNFNWYKPVDAIIDNQILNLLYDLETGSNLTIDFFLNTIKKLEVIKKQHIDLQRRTGSNEKRI